MKEMIEKGMIDTMHFEKPACNMLLLPMALTLLLSACAQHATEPLTRNEPPLVVSTPSAAREPVELRPGHPQTYTVVPGDTLWGISGRFLMNPWRWQEIWQENPQIENPNLIFPGDVIHLYYEGGEPRLQVTSRHAGTPGIVKLSPQVRIESLAQAIPTLPRDAIEQFLRRSRVATADDWDAAPYIVGAVDHDTIFSAGRRVYARGGDFDQRLYQVFRPGREYRDPDTGELLGTDLSYVGEAVVEKADDPAVLMLTTTTQESRPGDRLLEVAEQDEPIQFLPQPAPPDTRGQIIAAVNGGTVFAQYHTLVINLGELDGMEPGYVLAIYNRGGEMRDPLGPGRVLLPDTRAGLMMIYKVFDRTSYGLVTDTTRAVRILDIVTEP
jgi:hypothetical protein